MSTQQQQASSSSNSDKININLIELKETVDRIASYNGVEIVQILNTSGDIIAECVNTSSNNSNNNNIRSPMATPTSNTNAVTSSSDFGNDDMTLAASSQNNASLSTASTSHTLLRTAHQYIQNFKKENESTNDNDEITFVQIRSKNGYELMIAPHYGYALVVVKLIA
jgi:hypothetical protein